MQHFINSLTTVTTTASFTIYTKSPTTINMCLAITTNDIQSSSETCCPKTIAAEAGTTDITIPTFPVETAPQQLDVTSLTSAELSELKINDPFMYYSIPSVRNAALHGKDVDASFLDVPSRSTSVDNECPKRSVTRKRRISTECHPDIMLEEIFADQEFMASLNELKSDVSVLLEDSYDAHAGSLFEYLFELKEPR
ncbi:hypothetical protein ACHAWX_000964 [Stephanocyclus meneghinianus]